MYPADLRRLREVRATVGLALDGLGMGRASAVGATVPVIVDELAANAVVHARTPFGVGLVAMPVGVRVEVADRAPGFSPDHPAAFLGHPTLRECRGSRSSSSQRSFARDGGALSAS